MIIINSINEAIDKKLIAENQKKEREHKSSGKLSASALGNPNQWQVLHSLGVEKKPIDAYTLRKFKRGTEIEDWLLKHVPNLLDSQKFVEFNNTVGYVDAIVDTSNWSKSFGVIPLEVKSVTNAKYKHIAKGSPQDGHILQACLYALGMKTDHFGLIYVASDDLRTKTFIFETKDVSNRVEKIINDYQEAVERQEIPVFEPLYSWQSKIKYNPYPEFADLTVDELKEKAKRLKLFE